MPTPAVPTAPSIRCRLSDTVSDAVEFSAQDGTTLAAGCRRAFARYIDRHGATRFGGPVALELQVRPIGSAGDGWFAPVRGGAPVRVQVDARTLDLRADGEWEAIWQWVVASRADDQTLNQFLRDGRAFGLFDPTREDDEAGDAE